MKQNVMHSLTLALTALALFSAGMPLRASETDDRIESSFRKTYVYTAYLSDDAVKIEAKDGVVTLTGAVADETHKSMAQETAAGLPGVTRVDNQLTFSETAAANADAMICRKVILALQLHRGMGASRIGVEVKDGVVTLTGVASSQEEKDLVAEYATDIEGVKQVWNTMVLTVSAALPRQKTGETLDDASINAQAVTALMTHRSTRSVITRVATHHGVVTLTGITTNAAQRALIAKYVSAIYGVTGVQNQMTIEGVPGP